MQPRSKGAALRGMRLDLGEAQSKSVFNPKLLKGQLSLDPKVGEQVPLREVGVK